MGFNISSQKTNLLSEVEDWLADDVIEHFGISCICVCCPFPYHNVLDECFYLSTQETKWWSAREHCLDIKGDLAKPKHQYALKDFIFKKAGDVRVFIGGKDEYKDRNFKWLDGTPVNDSEWAPGEPNNEWKKEHCLGFISSKEPMLMDIICSQKLRFVCQYYPGP
nr:low affinity immunoglobulin epsilon Fc receptor-like [Procambarus clarkii]